MHTASDAIKESGWRTLVVSAVLAGAWLGLAVSICDAIPFSPYESRTPESNPLVEGLRQLTDDQLKGAEASFKEALMKDSNRFEAYLGLAEISIRQKNLDMAQKHLEKARAVQPKHVDVETAWGRFYVIKRDYNHAAAAFKRAIEIDDAAIAPRLDLADLDLTALRKPQAAADLYRAVIAKQPSHAGAYYGLGIAYADLGSMEKAKDAWKESSRLAPSNPSPSFALARLYVMQKQYDAALTQYDAVLKADKSFAQAHVGRGDVWQVKGNDQEALAEYQKAVGVNPQLAEAYERIGMLHQKHKRWAEAERAYLAALEIKPKSALSYNNLAWVMLEQKGREEKAVQWATKAVDLHPQSSQFQDTLGWAYRAAGDNAKAIVVLERASSLDQKNPEALYHLGVAYAEAGRKKEAEATLRKALNQKSDFPGADDARAQLAVLNKS
jgi:tetratricopeptide (TPR) repeat protein